MLTLNSDESEDWLRGLGWSIEGPDGDVATTAEEVVAALGVERALALLDLPAGDAMPAAVRRGLLALRRSR